MCNPHSAPSYIFPIKLFFWVSKEISKVLHNPREVWLELLQAAWSGLHWTFIRSQLEVGFQQMSPVVSQPQEAQK